MFAHRFQNTPHHTIYNIFFLISRNNMETILPRLKRRQRTYKQSLQREEKKRMKLLGGRIVIKTKSLQRNDTAFAMPQKCVNYVVVNTNYERCRIQNYKGRWGQNIKVMMSYLRVLISETWLIIESWKIHWVNSEEWLKKKTRF